MVETRLTPATLSRWKQLLGPRTIERDRNLVLGADYLDPAPGVGILSSSFCSISPLSQSSYLTMAKVRPNIWAYVAEALPPSGQLPIDLNDPTISNSVEDVLQYAKLMRERCDEKRWRYRNKKGEEVILRDVFAKIVTWVDKFKQVGDTIVQYDPVHAALPWAAVRFVLQIAVNDQQVFGAMAEGLELVSNLITRCAVWEDLYLMKQSAMQDQFIEALIKLYEAVLIYLGKAGKYYKQNSAGK